MPPRSRPGDRFELRAEMPLIVGLTACSAEMSNNYRLKPIDYDVIQERRRDLGRRVRAPRRYPRYLARHRREPHRPFWSVMIPVYNCAAYLRATLGSVLPQLTPDHDAQIEVVDDCSTKDDPCGRRSRVRPRPRALLPTAAAIVGPQATFTTCIERSRGEWVHILHADDLVADGFYAAIRADGTRPIPPWERRSVARCSIDATGRRAAICRSSNPRKTGIQHDLIDRFAVDNLIMFPSIAVPPPDLRDVSAASTLTCFTPPIGTCGAGSRSRSQSGTTRPRSRSIGCMNSPTPRASCATGANIADARHAIEIARTYLPPRSTRRPDSPRATLPRRLRARGRRGDDRATRLAERTRPGA